MEVMGDSDGFKHIPIRLYNRNQPLPQKLVKSFATIHSNENQSPIKRPMTLFDLVEEYFPSKAEKGNFCNCPQDVNWKCQAVQKILNHSKSHKVP
jgi:hypothetical protein